MQGPAHNTPFRLWAPAIGCDLKAQGGRAVPPRSAWLFSVLSGLLLPSFHPVRSNRSLQGLLFLPGGCGLYSALW